MQLPELVRQMGKAEGRARVYIEDYVYTYLSQLRKEMTVFPLRAVLFGHACHKQEQYVYLIYGAACVIEELEQGRTEEQIRKEFFEEYELIGYVNIYGKGQKLPDKKEGYYIFYEKNEAMQNYLLSCYERKKKEDAGREKEEYSGIKKAELLSLPKLSSPIGDMIKKFFYGGCIILLALAVTTINDYNKMHGFVEAAERAVVLTEREN